MKISYESSDLIADVREDIALFGNSFKVFAIYHKDYDVITDYIDADMPTYEELAGASEAEYQEAVSEYKEDLAKLEGRKYELLTLAELLEKLKAQNSII